MAGLLGSVLAGGVKSVADGKIKDIERQEEFDLQNKLLEARIDKEMRLKEAGYEMEDKRAAAQQEKRAGYLKGEDGQELSTQEAAQKAIQAGDFEAGEGLLKVTPKTDKTFESVKLDDGSVLAFDKSTGKGEIIRKGSGTTSFKSIEEAIVNESDPVKRAELISIKKQITAAGRAPERASDDDLTYADWKKKPANAGKGRDDYAKEKSSWNKTDENYQTVTEKPVIGFDGTNKLGKDGKPLMTKSVTRKEKIPEKPLKPWERKY